MHHQEVKSEVNRILKFCDQSAPGCQVEVFVDEAEKFRIRVIDAGVTLIHPDLALDAKQLAAKSDDKLWAFLESISHRLLQRPRRQRSSASLESTQ